MSLGGRSVREWKLRISKPEFIAWVQFYKQQPFDDFHRFHRPAALIASSMGGTEIDKLLDFLQPPARIQFTDLDLQVFETFGYKSPE